jgi:hypothetical protein
MARSRTAPESFDLVWKSGRVIEVGVPDVQRFIDARRGQSLIHFGAAASHLTARLLAWDAPLPTSAFGPDAGIIPQSSPATNEPASRERLDRMVAALRSQMDAGALGVGMGLEYAPGATRDEVTEFFKLAQRAGGPVFVHIRKSGAGVGVEAISQRGQAHESQPTGWQHKCCIDNKSVVMFRSDESRVQAVASPAGLHV